jgi:hypothetical protein
VTDSEAREIERQIEADDEASCLEGGRQEYLVDKIKDVERFDASVLRRFSLERLKFSGFDVIAKETMLSKPTLLQELIDKRRRWASFDVVSVSKTSSHSGVIGAFDLCFS